MVKANPRATTLENRCLSSSPSTSRDILRCHLSYSTSHGHVHSSNPVAMRERDHASDHILYVDIDRHTNREEERGWGWGGGYKLPWHIHRRGGDFTAKGGARGG